MAPLSWSKRCRQTVATMIGPIDLLETEPLDVQDQGNRNAQDHVDDDVREGPEEVEEEEPQELEIRDVQLALDDLGVVVETDEIRLDLAAQVLELEVGERHPGLEEQRIEGDDPHHQERRQEVEERGPRIRREAPATARLSQSDRWSGHDQTS